MGASLFATKDKFHDPQANKGYFDYNKKIDTKSLEQRTALNKMLDGNIAEQFDALIKVTIAQLQNHNPDPDQQVNVSEIVNNFVSIIQTAQQAKSNELAAEGHNLMKEGIAMQATNLLETEIQRKSNVFEYKNEPIKIFYHIPEKASTASMEILNSSGQKVATLPLDSSMGTHVTEWDGLADTGLAANQGRHFVRILLKGPNGEMLRDKHGDPVHADTEFSGKIDAFDKGEDGSITFYDGTVPVSFKEDITRISRANKAYQLANKNAEEISEIRMLLEKEKNIINDSDGVELN